jgi:hypothetical protein
VNKLNTFIAFIGSVSMTVTAVILGGQMLVLLGIGGGFLILLAIAYILDRSGFQREALDQRFKQETLKLWVKQEMHENAITAMCLRMTDEELVEWVEYWAEELDIEHMFSVGVKEAIRRTQDKHGPISNLFLLKFVPDIHECPNCDAKIDRLAEKCEHCGSPIDWKVIRERMNENEERERTKDTPNSKD